MIAAVNGYIADMQRAQSATAKVGAEAAETAAKLEKQHQAMTEIGRGVAAVGAVAAVAFGIAVTKFAEFDQAMSNVKAATQETSANMELLRDAALEAGASTVFSATEAANAIEALGKANIATADITGGALAGSLDLAAAASIGVAEAADIAAIAMKQFNLEGADVPHIADLLAAGAGKAVGDVDELAQALNQAGLVANGAGQSIEDTTGTLAAFADAGLKGSDAGTSLKAAIIALQAPTQKSRDIMEQYGLSFYDTSGSMLSFDKIAGQLETKLGGLDDETRNAALAQIFGNDALRVANVLYDEGAKGIAKYIEQTNDSGYAARVAADKLNNLTGDVEKLGGAIDTALIKSGSAANDSLRTITQAATGIVDAIGSLPDPILGVGLALTGLVGTIGLVGGAALLAVPKVAQFKIALSTLNISAGSAARSVGAMAGAVAVAGVAFAVFAEQQARLSADTRELQDSLSETTGAVTDYTREIIAKKLAEGNVFKAAEAAGISQKKLTDAVIEGGEQLDKYRDALDPVKSSLSFVEASGAAQRLDELDISLERSRENLEDEAAAADESAEKTTDAATAYQEAADKAEELETNLRTLIDTVNEANGVGQDAVSANIAYRDALADVDAVIKSGEGTRDDHLGLLVGMADKSQAAAEAQFQLDNDTTAYIDTLKAGRQDLLDRATDLGLTADEAKNLADQIYGIPTEREVAVIADVSQATRTIEDFQKSYGTLYGSIIYRATRAGDDYLTDGVSGGYADGGEIPGRPSRQDNVLIHAATGEFVVNTEAAQRNKALLHYINNGGRIRGYADGGEIQPRYAPSMPSFSGGGSGGGGRAVEINQTILPQPGMSEYAIGQAAAQSAAFWMGTGE